MTTHVSHLELSILAGANLKGDEQDKHYSTSVSHFFEGKYEQVLEASKIASQIFREPSDDLTTSVESYVKKNLEKIFESSCDNSQTRDLELLMVGVSCINLFVQNNWHGPLTEKDPLSFCHPKFTDQSKISNEIIEELSIDGEEMYGKTRHIVYLYLAKLIFLEGRQFLSHLQTWDWWLMRCLKLQQLLLTERSPTLKATVLEIIENVSKKEPLMTEDKFREIQILFHIEAGYAKHDFLEFKSSAEHFNSAKKISGMDVRLTGAMGKRTQFQKEDKAQLVLKVSRADEEEKKDNVFQVPCGVPNVLPLDDDTVLNEVAYTDEDATSTPDLSSFEHVFILGLMEHHRRNVAHEKLTTEEVLTYLAYLLHHSTNWNVTAAALHLRSRLERDSRRRIERSMMQLEILAKPESTPTSSVDVPARLALFFACHVSPSWVVKKDYASMLLSLGLLGEALDVFETLEMWDNVIACYQRLKKLEKAESVIRERLAVKETPALLCFLGDITGRLEDYQKAWELSRHRNSRSQRCMGYIHFNSHNFEKAMECFEKSLEINSLQIPLWFTYGCAAMTCEKFLLGVKAFKRCVAIDYDNFEAWSNLATCYVQLKDKRKAYATLQDALKCNYESWKLWENSLVIGTDVGAFGDVIRSYHRLIDLKHKWVDVEVLSILTRAVIEKMPGFDGRPADYLHGDLMKLLGRITSSVTGEGEIWANYAKLSLVKAKDREPDVDKALQYLQKAYRCFSQKADWEKDMESCKKVSEEAVKLSETYIQCSEGKPQDQAIQLLSSAKLNLRGALVKVQKQHTDPVTQELSTQVTELCNQMDSTLQDIIQRIESLKS